jgi:hypothetical protein
VEATKAEADKCELHQKSFSSPKNGHFQESEQGTVEFVHLNKNTGGLIACQAIKQKAWELAIS